ncbi:MAG: DNA cytosine methyltransferase [Acidobacteriota bacterium]|nr:DNA cytosine methyltransferase [Acidobacteriota bacterium]
MRIVSLFSGVGGLDLGFILAGHEVVWANDIDPNAVKTYRMNIGDHIVQGYIQEIPSNRIPESDIVIGGFPCQGFSMANMKRRASDIRNSLYLELLRVIADKKPLYFLAENVKGLVTLEGGRVLSLILRDFEDAGYRVKYKVLNAADYGVPQVRHRVIFIGEREDRTQTIDFPPPTHADPSSGTRLFLRPWVTISEALRGVPEPDTNSTIHNHTYSKYKLRFNGYLGHRRIDPDRPAPTVTARGDDRGGVVVLHHPSNQRRMSARELALVQSFPIDFEFAGCQSSVYRLVANAVPPLLAKALGSMFPVGESHGRAYKTAR